MTSLVERALILAQRAHAGQTRRGGDVPYITHPIMVAFKLHGYGFPETVIAAALCHDVLEDTAVSEDELRQELGDVVNIIKEVSEDKGLAWEERKKQYIESIRTASTEAKAVSAADKVHNAENFLATYALHGTKAWEFFRRGKEQKIQFEESMLSMLEESFEHPLVDEYRALVEQIRTLP